MGEMRWKESLPEGESSLDKLSHARLGTPGAHVCHRDRQNDREEQDDQERVSEAQSEADCTDHAKSDSVASQQYVSTSFPMPPRFVQTQDPVP